MALFWLPAILYSLGDPEWKRREGDLSIRPIRSPRIALKLSPPSAAIRQ